MAKKSKIVKFKNVKIVEENNQLILQLFSEDGENLNTTENLSEQLKVLQDVVNISIKPSKKGKTPVRKPIFKYKCGCDVEIKSTVEGLVIECKQCGELFETKVKDDV